MKEEARKKAAKEANEKAKAKKIILDHQVLVTGELTEIGVQTQLSLEDIRHMEERACEERVVHKNILTQDFLKSDEPRASDVIMFYTGLPSYARLVAVFNFVSADLKEHHNSNLSLFQEFLVSIINLRFNLCDQDIAYRFGVSLSKTFRKWINRMYIRLKPTIKWPDHEILKTMLNVFRRNFKRCICIIDCFEVFCERLSDLMARAQTYSQNKHHNTVKFLIATTPQRIVSFISKG